MKGFRPVFQTYLRTLHHYFFPPRWKHYFPFFSLLSLGLLLLVLEFFGFRRVFRYMGEIQDFPLFFIQVLLERFVGLIFLICYSMIFMSSMINGLSSFFLSKNLPFLYTLPIPRWKVLVVKFLENWATSTYLIVLFLSCFLWSHAYSFRLGWLHNLTLVGLLIIFTLSPVAMGSTMLMILIRYFPVRRIHQVVTLLGGVFLGVLMIAVRMMKPERLLNPTDTDDFVRLIQDLTFPSLNHLPSSWASNIVIYGGSAVLFKLLGFTLVTLIVFAFVTAWVYDRAFVHSHESRTLRGKPVWKQGKVKITGRTSSLIRKDVKLFWRDATQWSQILLLAALVIVYLLNIRNLAIQLPMVRWVVSFINLGLAGFVIAALSVRFLFPSVSMEGRSFWILRTLPVSFRVLLWCKYLIFFPPFLIFAQSLVYFSNRILQVESFFVQLSALNILAACFALTGLAIGIGAILPNFKSDNPSQIAVGPGGVLYMLLSFIYLAAMLILQSKPVWFHMIRATDRIYSWPYFSAAAVITLLVALVPMELGARRLAAREYTVS